MLLTRFPRSSFWRELGSLFQITYQVQIVTSGFAIRPSSTDPPICDEVSLKCRVFKDSRVVIREPYSYPGCEFEDIELRKGTRIRRRVRICLIPENAREKFFEPGQPGISIGSRNCHIGVFNYRVRSFLTSGEVNWQTIRYVGEHSNPWGNKVSAEWPLKLWGTLEKNVWIESRESYVQAGSAGLPSSYVLISPGVLGLNVPSAASLVCKWGAAIDSLYMLAECWIISNSYFYTPGKHSRRVPKKVPNFQGTYWCR